METETKQRQDINQGNATAWKTANNTTRKQNKKRETEISVRGVSTWVEEETWAAWDFALLSVLEERGEYDATRQDKMLCTTETKGHLNRVRKWSYLGKSGRNLNEWKCFPETNDCRCYTTSYTNPRPRQATKCGFDSVADLKWILTRSQINVFKKTFRTHFYWKKTLQAARDDFRYASHHFEQNKPILNGVDFCG